LINTAKFTDDNITELLHLSFFCKQNKQEYGDQGITEGTKV